jgi:predicted CXXCH cytochrome family protein
MCNQDSCSPEVKKMKTTPQHKKHARSILLSGLLVGILSMAVVVGAAGAVSRPGMDAQGTSTPPPATEPPTTESIPSKDCAECHPNVEKAWMDSSHAHAYDDAEFVERWNSLGSPGECLSCHTTNYQSTTNSFTGEGVQCEACHGEAIEGHPPAIVPVKADTEYCGSCHTTTLGEWRLTGHSTAGVGCMDCHDPHSQEALFDNPDDLCLNCHRNEMGDYLEDLHIQKDIGCVDCHQLIIPPDPVPDDGIVPTGHAFTITTDTCVACHTDALHAGFSLPGYEDGAKAANGNHAETDEGQPTESPVTEEISTGQELTPEQRIQALEASLASSRFSSLFQGGIIGLVLGGMTIFYLSRNRRKSSDVDEDNTPENAPIVDGEVIDQELEKVLVYIENGLDWIINAFKKAGDWAKSKLPRGKAKGKDSSKPNKEA